MLTIGKLGRTRGRLEYYEAQVAAGLEDYYAGRGESPGRWRGAGAQALGLSEREPVSRSGFLALMNGRHPHRDLTLRAMGARSTVSGFDLTFSAPKSVSVLYAIADEPVARQLSAAHEEAVSAALGYLEREACRTRRGRGGAQRVAGEGFVAAAYRHRMSRAGDPQLHTHVVVGNLTQAEGRFTALDARALYEHKSAGGAVYRAVLRARVRERLPWATWRTAGRGLFELAGVPEPVLRHFSQRRAEIVDRARELVGAGGVAELSRESMQGIALATRRAKRHGIDAGSWRGQARARAAEHGLGRAGLGQLVSKPSTVSGRPDLDAAARHLSGPEGLTERHNTFAQRHALAELAGAFDQGASLQEIDAATGRYLNDASVVHLVDSDQGEARYTTRGLLELEARLVAGAARRSTTRAGVVPRELVAQVLTEHRPRLNPEQASTVEQIACRGHGFDAVCALAGTGKTTMIGALVTAYRRAGWRVLGAAPTARAARQLRTMTGVQADTLHALAGRLSWDELDDRTVLLLDEAGMAPTRVSAAVLAQAELAGAKVVAVGDPGQLSAVEAGGWLGALARRRAPAELRQVMRQRDRREQQALEALHDGDPEPYLRHQADKLTLHETEVGALLQVRDQWLAARPVHGPAASVMLARDNLTRERLNRAARASLKAERLLAPNGVYIGGREYAAGDRVIARRNDRVKDIDNGSLATVVAVDATSWSVTVRLDCGGRRRLDHDYVAEHLEHAYALTAHAAQGATVGFAAVVGRAHDFTREWAYTALSRAREETRIHVICEPVEEELERGEYGPVPDHPSPAQTLSALRRALCRSEAEPLALEHAAPPPPAISPGRCPAPELTGLRVLRSSRGATPTLGVRL
jgi:conjugative relaxase-like TrwC/TraI family protein